LFGPAPDFEGTAVIVLTCDCGRKLQIREEFAGKQGKCPACGQTLDIPAADEPAAKLAATAEPVLEAEVVEDAQPAASPESEPTNHVGDPLPEDADFFVPPPEEIGPVLSCHTTLRQGQRPWAIEKRWMLACAVAMGCVLVALIFVALLDIENIAGPIALFLVLGVIAVTVTLLATRFKHTCTYVGRDGVARFVCSGTRDRIVTDEVFCFRTASDLRISQTRHYTNGVYQNTTFSFTWSDVGGRTRYSIAGTHTSKEGTPPAKHSYNYARAAENAWTGFLFADVSRQIELGGGVLFNLARGGWVRLGPQKIIFGIKGDPDEWQADEVAGVKIDNGQITFRHVNARSGLFSSSGTHRFAIENLANAQLFFFLLTRLVGVSVG
jgi:hypothetical protein